MQISNFAKITRVVLVVLMLGLTAAAFAQNAIEPTATADAAAVTVTAPKPAALYYSIAASIAFGCMGAGYAVGKVGSAVMGAAAEKPEVIGKAIAFVAMGEGIALFGFLVALFLWTKI